MSGFRSRAVRRLAREESGFTLIELLMVVMILGILTLTAVPTYLSMRDRAYKATVASNTKTVVEAARLYAADNSPNSSNDPDAGISLLDSGYSGMTTTYLKAYNSNIPKGSYISSSGTQAAGVTVRAALDATHYCIYSQQGRWFAYQLNASAPIYVTVNAAAVCT